MGFLRLAGACGLAAGALALAAFASLFALANVARNANPALVNSVADDPLAPLLELHGQLSVNPGRILDQSVGPLALQSLTREPLNPVALRMLAIQASARNDPGRSARFASLSERITRRDLFTQLILIEQAVQRNSIPVALHHYDVALRTHEGAGNILFPILGTAISNDAIREALVPFVRSHAAWIPSFVQFAASEANAPQTTRLLLAAGPARWPSLVRQNAPALLTALVNQRQFALAEQLLLQLPGTPPGVLRQIDFSPQTTNEVLGPFAWSAVNGGSLGASFEASSEGRSVAHLFATPGARGVVLRRVLSLAPGAYRHSEARSLGAGDASSRAFWEMKCLGGQTSEVIWRGPADQASYRATRIAGPIIPIGCTEQVLELTAVGGDGDQGLDLTIGSFILER